jgi:protein-disulfide isomerase
VGALYYYFTVIKGEKPGAAYAVEAPIEADANANVEAPVVEAGAEEASEDGINNSEEIDVDAALAPRTLGDTSAPIKIMEFASLSCGHCASFHGSTFYSLKSDYIDTGKAYIIFSDMPLNRPALEGSMLARCLPEDQYVPFIAKLFNEQADWAFGSDFSNKLKNYAREFGMGEDRAEACVDNQDLRAGLIARIKAAQSQWDISSTPSFVINNKQVLTGALPLSSFEEAFEALEAE